MNKVIPKEFKVRKGTKNEMKNEADMANQSALEETDLRTIIEKYGIIPEQKIEPIYDISIGNKTPIAKRLEYAENVQNYFDTLPAEVRKDFKDDYRNLYVDLINQKYDKLKKYGIIEQEIGVENVKNNKENNKPSASGDNSNQNSTQ